ncbi:MAG: hypothetical protein JNL52_07740 [Flavobacteriales bacterium]|nr:hypothetical protein [Flavobacteriales bacterium]
MKTRINRLLVVFASVLTLGYVRASGPEGHAAANTASAPPVVTATASTAALDRALDHQLSRHLSFPVLAKEHMLGEVFVSFVIDKEGKVEVVHCASDNDALKAYVLRKLSRVDIGENPDGMWKTTHLHIVFRPEKA